MSHEVSPVPSLLFTEKIRIGSQVFQREKYLWEGEPVSLLVAVFDEQPVSLVRDIQLEETGIVTEPQSLLIDQKATSSLLLDGRPAGYTLEHYLSQIPESAVAVPANQWGWQREAFVVVDGELKTIKNDQDQLSGRFSVIAKHGPHWKTQTITLDQGQLGREDQTRVQEMAVGFSGPEIVKDGVVVPLEQLLDDPRIKADFRNLVDISAGLSVPSKFFELVRKFNPQTQQQLSRLVREKPSSVVVRQLLSENDGEQLYPVLQDLLDEYQLSHLRIDKKHEEYRFGILAKLPVQRMPFIAYGVNQAGQLLMMSVDGRQKESMGVTISQLAVLMQQHGAISAVLGPGGGDVMVAVKDSTGIRYLNQPSTRNEQGQSVDRPVANVLIFKL